MHKPVVALLLTLLTGCGWQLQGYQQYRDGAAQQLKSIDLVEKMDNRLFHAALLQRFKDLSITVDKAAPVRLTVHEESTEKRPLSYGSTGIPVQYQLIMNIRFSFTKDKALEPIERRLVARRQYDFDTELIIAKYEEERNLLQGMRVELANRILASLNK